MAELADALDSGSSEQYAHRGSSPRFGTSLTKVSGSVVKVNTYTEIAKYCNSTAMKRTLHLARPFAQTECFMSIVVSLVPLYSC